MAQMRRPGLSALQKMDPWDRWKSGQSHSEMGRAFGKDPASIHGVSAATGGFAPALRRRSRRVLSLVEREEISRGIVSGRSMRVIAADLKRSPSTVSREIARHGGLEKYRANAADEAAWNHARRPKQCRLAANGRLREIVSRKLGLEWSPEQISG